MEFLVSVIAGIALALVAPWIPRIARDATGWIIGLLPLGLFLFFVSYIPSVAEGTTFSEMHEWVPAFGVNLSFYLDGLSLLFALLVTGIGTLIMVYAGGYLHGHRDVGRFYAFILAFMASMLGVVLSDNLVTLFVFWELTSITSYLLIGFENEDSASRKSALQALLITSGGGLALLAGFVLLGNVGGTFRITELNAAAPEIRGHELYRLILILVLAGAFTKSAQFPFHFWLPNAMTAPTPVSAYLHSATMVKLGVFLLARLSPAISGTSDWIFAVSTFGAVTMILSAYLALKQSDMKRILAYATVSALGTMVLLLGLSSEGAVKASLVFLVAHALYKGALFMVAGTVDHETGTRNVDALGGLWRTMPVTAGAGILAALSLAGLMPLFSFIGKELLFEALFEAPFAKPVLMVVVVVSMMLFVAIAAIIALKPFTGPLKPTPKKPHEAPVSMLLGPVFLAVGGLLIGLLPKLVEDTLISPAADAVAGRPVSVHLALWHGLNPALLLSAVTIIGGLAIYFEWINIHGTPSWMQALMNRGPERWYDLGMKGLVSIAHVQTDFIQTGYLRTYTRVVLAVTALAVGGTLILKGGFTGAPVVTDPRFYELALAALMITAAAFAALSQSRLAAIAALGVVGLGVALVYLFHGAPDLAMTQILVETLTVLLFVLVLLRTPAFTHASTMGTRARDALVAIAVGTTMTLLVLTATTTQLHAPISGFFAENSYIAAHGRNVVNVILVDFRALDTLGEITVLAVAALGVFALLKLKPLRRDPA